MFLDGLFGTGSWTYPLDVLGPMALLAQFFFNHADLNHWIVLNLTSYFTNDRTGPFFSLMFQNIPWYFTALGTVILFSSQGQAIYALYNDANTFTQLSTNWLAWVFLIMGAINMQID